jgi:hypothetical protein
VGHGKWGGEPIYSLKWAVGQGTSWWCPKSGHCLLAQRVDDTFHSHPIQADPGLPIRLFPSVRPLTRTRKFSIVNLHGDTLSERYPIILDGDSGLLQSRLSIL